MDVKPFSIELAFNKKGLRYTFSLFFAMIMVVKDLYLYSIKRLKFL